MYLNYAPKLLFKLRYLRNLELKKEKEKLFNKLVSWSAESHENINKLDSQLPEKSQ